MTFHFVLNGSKRFFIINFISLDRVISANFPFAQEFSAGVLLGRDVGFGNVGSLVGSPFS